MKRIWGALLCVLIILNLTACGMLEPETASETSAEVSTVPSTTEEAETETQPVRETEAPLDVKDAPKICITKIYRIPMPTAEDPERVLTMDGQGNILENAVIPTPVFDVISGELRYYTLEEYRKDGSLEAAWLYSARGKALEGCANCVYGDGLGTFVVKCLQPDDPASLLGSDGGAAGCLYDPVGKVTVAEDVCSVEKLTRKTAVCLDAKRHILGVYDRDGEKLYGDPFEGAFTYGYGCGAFILGYPESGCAILNEKLEVVDTAPKMFDMELYDCGAQGVLCVKKDDDQRHIYAADGWKLLGTFPADFQCTDGINVICGDDFNEEAKLHSMRGKRLAGPFDKIGLLKDGRDMPIGMTLARKDDTIYVLNKYGETMAKRRIYGLSRAYSTFDGLIMCEYSFENDWTGKKEMGVALLMQDLKWLSDRDRNFIAMDRVTEGIYSGTRQNGENSFRTDLFNEKGEVIFKRVVRLGTADGDAIAVCGQESFGLIDHKGEWIAKMDLNDGGNG